MLTLFKKIFEHKCPTCNEQLTSLSDSLCSSKVCPQGHYKEENYGTLGVRIIYDRLK